MFPQYSSIEEAMKAYDFHMEQVVKLPVDDAGTMYSARLWHQQSAKHARWYAERLREQEQQQNNCSE